LQASLGRRRLWISFRNRRWKRRGTRFLRSSAAFLGHAVVSESVYRRATTRDPPPARSAWRRGVERCPCNRARSIPLGGTTPPAGLPSLPSPMTLDLTALNLGSSTYPGPYVTLTVTVPAGGGDATVGVKGDSSGGFSYALDELGLNLSTKAIVSGLPWGWSRSAGKQVSASVLSTPCSELMADFPRLSVDLPLRSRRTPESF
jgi:hypothetical protein